MAFSSKNWADWDENIVRDVDLTKEYLSLPENICGFESFSKEIGS